MELAVLTLKTIALSPGARRFSQGRLMRMARGALAIMTLSAVGLFGCTDVSIAVARHQITRGNYSAAHDYFAAALMRKDSLSLRQRQEVMDGLCRTEYQIGAPTYPLAHQLRTCTAALKQPDSASGPIFANLARQERVALSQTIAAALAQPDIARADEAILRYRSLPGNDSEAIARWTRQLWTVVNREAAQSRPERGLAPAISQLSHRFAHLKSMNDRQFRRWVEANMIIAGTPMVSNVEIGRRTVDLWLGDDQFGNAALNLDRFARVNDGLVARCRCDGQTKVALEGSGLPAYLVRFDPASRRSEVLILDQPRLAQNQ